MKKIVSVKQYLEDQIADLTASKQALRSKWDGTTVAPAVIEGDEYQGDEATIGVIISMLKSVLYLYQSKFQENE